MVLGVVRIADWRRLPAPAGRHYLRAYLSKTRPDGAGHSRYREPYCTQQLM